MRYSDNPQDWFDLHQPIGTNERFSHNQCGDRRGRLYVRRTNEGWKWYCHNCGKGGNKYARRSERIQSSLRENVCTRHTETGQVYEQVGGGEDWWTSRLAVDWLSPYGLTSSETEHFTTDGRHLCLPILDRRGGQYGVQLRRLTKTRGPKYLTQYTTQKREGSWSRVQLSNKDLDQSVCIVEDIVSSIKCGRVMDSVALLGSPYNIPDPIANIITEHYGKVYVWLDPDKKSTALNYTKRLSALYGLDVTPIFTDEDPKMYSTKQLEEALSADL